MSCSRTVFRPALAAAALALAAEGAFANDTFAVLGAGGLKIAATQDISMDSEDLYLSPSKVRVDYVFRNTSDSDVRSIVAFPMPDIELDPNVLQGIADPDSDNFLDFAVSQDGRAIEPQLQQRAVVNGVDGTDLLEAQDIPVFPITAETRLAIDRLPAEVLADWQAHGMIRAGEGPDEEGNPSYDPVWTVRSAYWWDALFPAGKAVRVHHDYKPSIGGTSSIRWADSEDGFIKDYRDKYCVNEAFVKRARQIAEEEDLPANTRPMDKWLSYVLVTGGNWSGGTIGRFHLTVDKERPQDIVSFCGDGVKKTGPTTFEMTAENFYPERDIDVLIIGQFEAEE